MATGYKSGGHTVAHDLCSNLCTYVYRAMTMLTGNVIPSVTQVIPIEWPLEDSPSGSLRRTDSSQNIADLLTSKKIDLVINLPLRLHRLTAIVTHGYKTRRLAVQNHIPLITDVKCAKLFVKVSHV